MSEEEGIDLHEHTCVECKNVFYTELQPKIIRDITKPSYCPFCGRKFTSSYLTENVII